MSIIIRMRGLVIAPAIFVLLAWNAYLTYRLVAVTTWSSGGGQSSSKSDCNQVDDAPSHQPQQRRQQHQQYQQHHDEKQNNKVVPDWHRAIDCSVYDNMCFATSNTRRRYEPYPFPLGRHIKNLHEFEFDHMSLSSDSDAMPQEWTRALLEGVDDIDNNDNIDDNDDNKRRRVSYIYPPEVLTTPLQISQCIRQSMNETWQHQIKSLLATNRIRKESITNMVAFTISDYSYAYDMMHDVFQMNSDIVGFDGSFFMVALDESTMEMACRYGYPAVAWHTHGVDDGGDDGGDGGDDGGKPDDNNISQLKRDVANTKFEVSLLLVTLGIDFFFYEMDVWFLTSPKELIADYHAQPMHDILLSSHGKDPQSVNIGVYSVASNRRTAEFFDVCLRMARESPATHDQWIVSQLLLLAWTIHQTGRPGLQLKRMWYPPPRRNPPTMEFPPVYGTYNTAEIQAGEYLLPARSTVAVHPLCRSPLKKPWGKKMVAKELGAWFGFTGRRGAGGDGGGGGYYARSGSHRRYLWMDGHDTPNAYNTVQNFEYDAMNSESLVVNHVESFRWTMATLLALARRCGRIFQMPSVMSEEGVHYLWTVLDFETVDEMGIDYRETNFPHNRKSWHSETVSFQSVARTALAPLKDVDKEGTMYVQYPTTDNNNNNTSTTTITKAWKFNNATAEERALDAWWALHTAIPEVDSSELLLVNPHFVSAPYARKLRSKLSRSRKEKNYEPSVAEKEIFRVYERLKWCPGDKIVNKDHVVGRSSAEGSCHGKGHLYTSFGP